MAKRLFAVPTWTPAATADNTTFGAGAYMAVGAANATQVVNVSEIMVEGAGVDATKVNGMQFARDIVLGATPAALVAPNADGPKNGVATALASPALVFVGATTNPSRSNVTTMARLLLTINCGGGIIRWKPADATELWQIIGTAVSVSESSLSNSTALGTTAGLMSAHIEYEGQ